MTAWAPPADALERLRALAAEATRGPWVRSEDEPWSVYEAKYEPGLVAECPLFGDAAYLAAIWPERVTALLDVAKAAEGLRGAINPLANTVAAYDDLPILSPGMALDKAQVDVSPEELRAARTALSAWDAAIARLKALS